MSIISFAPFKEEQGDMPRSTLVPTGILQANLISPTSLASDCFVKQQFSAKLQGFLVGYVNSIYSNYSVYSQ